MAAGAAARAVVLTGGRSTRMGADKATLVLGGVRMVDHVLRACREAGLAGSIAGSAPPGLEDITLADPPGIAGPAAGLAAAMRAFPGVDVVLLATDQPYLRARTLRNLLATPGAAVVPVQGRRQTLCAVYRAECAGVLERLLVETPAPSLQTLLDRVAATEVGPDVWGHWGEDGSSWLSLDTPERWEAAAAVWPDPPRATIGP